LRRDPPDDGAFRGRFGRPDPVGGQHGGGRPEDRIDHSVGISRLLPVGAQLSRGDALALVHARTQADAEKATIAVLRAYSVGPAKPAAKKSVIRRIAAF
jgi:thymidine phosphorylase